MSFMKNFRRSSDEEKKIMSEYYDKYMEDYCNEKDPASKELMKAVLWLSEMVQDVTEEDSIREYFVWNAEFEATDWKKTADEAQKIINESWTFKWKVKRLLRNLFKNK